MMMIWYGPNYLMDGLIPFSYSNASVVGKLETILYHEASDKYYLDSLAKVIDFRI